LYVFLLDGFLTNLVPPTVIWCLMWPKDMDISAEYPFAIEVIIVKDFMD